MLIEYYKGHMEMENIRELLKVNTQGTTAFHIVEGAKKIGFEAKGVKCNIDDMNEDNMVLPCIANVIINKTYKHFVVIYKIDFVKKRMLIADPSNKIMYMSFDIFNSIFSGVLILLYPIDELPIENTKNLKSTLFLNIVKSHPILIKQISILSIFITILSIICSFFLEKICDSISIYGSKDIIILVLLLFIILSSVKSVSKYFREKILLLLNEKIDLRLTLDTYNKILLLPYKNYRSKTTGDIVTRLIDVGIINSTCSKIFLTLLIDLPLSLCATVLLLLINTQLCIISFIVLILYVLVMLMFKDYFDTSYTSLKKDNISVTSYMIESINNFETVKGLKIFNIMYHQFEKKFVSMLKKRYSYENMYCVQQFLKDLISECGLFLVYGMGALFVIKGEMNFSSLLTFGTLLSFFFEPVQSIINLEKDLRELDLVLKRQLDLEYKDNTGITNSMYKGDIKINDLSYTFDDQIDILKNINLKINFGEKIVITGSSGCGKSTLVKILMKYYQVDREKIKINNIDINDYDDSNGICYISQNENLYTDSLYNNITLYEKCNINKFIDICKMCNIDDIVSKNRLGYNLLIEENGFNLSGGERQRIVLARTLFRNFNMLVIDEGLSQIDVNMERKILKSIFEKFKNKTIIVISHRLENLDLFDRNIVMNGGEVINDKKKI